MSSILKLRILGIRAFDNHEPQELEFSSPLTLICGPNGVGKTTVIECLRYVATGDLPPNAKGGAFVHDPRMSSESEVKAQVKLLFRNSGGQRMVAARNMRLSVTGKGTSSFKTLEGYIKVQDKNLVSTGSVSSRCADLNVHIPLALGVPPSILNYVVFCHQEESLWPLAEPSVVKRRFDEIFEATKYTKALESLKVIRKDYISNIKVEKVQVDHLSADQQRVTEKHQLLDDLQTQTTQLQSQADHLQTLRMESSTELNLLVERSQKIQGLNYALRDIERRGSQMEENIELLTADIRDPLNDMGFDEIQQKLNESSEHEASLNSEIAAARQQRDKLTSQLEETRQQLALLANQRGRIEQLQEEHDQKLKKRDELTNDNHESWSAARQTELGELNVEIEDLEVANRQREEKLAQEISGEEAQRLQLRQRMSSLRQDLRNAEKTRTDLSEKVAQLEAASKGENTELIQSRLATLQQELTTASNKLEQFEQSNRVVQAARAVRDAEAAAEQARNAVQEAIDLSATQSRVQFLRDTVKETQSRLDSAVSKLGSALKTHEHAVPSAERQNAERQNAEQENAEQEDAEQENAEQENAEQENAERVLAETAKYVNDLQQQVSQAQLRLNTATNMLKETQMRRNRVTAEHTQLIQLLSAAGTDGPSQDFDAELIEAENALLAATEEQEQLAFAHSFFAKALAMAQSPHSAQCLLCDHHKTPQEAQVLATKLMNKIKALNISPEQAEAETESRRAHLETLRALKPRVDRHRQLSSDLAALTSEMEECESEVDLANTALRSANLKLEKAQRDQRAQEGKLRPLLNLVSRSRDETQEAQRKLDMETSISQATTTTTTTTTAAAAAAAAAVKTPQEAQQFMEHEESRLKQQRLELDKARSEHDRLKSRHSGLSHASQELKLKLSDFELKTSQLRQTQTQLEQVEGSIATLTRDFQTIENQLPSLETKIDGMRQHLRSVKHESQQAERKLAEQRSELVNAMKTVSELSTSITQFVEMHGTDPLASLRDETQAIQARITQLNSDSAEQDEEITQLEKQQTDFGSYKRNLNDNLRVRRLREELKGIQEEHARVSADLTAATTQIGGVQDYETQVRELQRQIGEYNHEISTKAGESRAIATQMQQIRHELATTYKHTAENYRQAVVKLQTSEGAAEDLVVYVRALDAAIMQYHSLKMAEINSLLDEMWKRTYTGTDIDTILIRSESDAGSASTRASYNYRVCMVKQDTELDMRGRCSAGQKVLASILIRMALAECFGNNSGLIVLDEPTTNLDRDNIDALAQSLSDVIASRRGQRNFQLIVITHDEHFLARMNPQSYCSYYYKITRDIRQLSKVMKLPIASLQA